MRVSLMPQSIKRRRVNYRATYLVGLFTSEQQHLKRVASIDALEALGSFGGESEASVIRRIAEDEHQRLAGPPCSLQPSIDERPANSLPLKIWSNGQRGESKRIGCSCRSDDLEPAEHDVPYDRVAQDGNECNRSMTTGAQHDNQIGFHPAVESAFEEGINRVKVIAAFVADLHVRVL
jgi:hypothetical protein